MKPTMDKISDPCPSCGSHAMASDGTHGGCYACGYTFTEEKPQEPEPECTCYLHPNGGWVRDIECPAHGLPWPLGRRALFDAP